MLCYVEKYLVFRDFVVKWNWCKRNENNAYIDVGFFPKHHM